MGVFKWENFSLAEGLVVVILLSSHSCIASLFQVIKIHYRNPLTSEEIKNLRFLGPAAFTKEAF